MKRHSTRKMHSAHLRGEHAGFNLRFADAGCVDCKADVDEVHAQWEQSFRDAQALANMLRTT